jgi:hypothetical protein
MRLALFSVVLAAVSVQQVVSSPFHRRATVDATDALVINYALTLELIENAFYTGALAKFDDTSFADAGFPDWVRNRFTEIAAHEAAHVLLLSTTLGDQATRPCNYTFPYTDVKSFVALSQMIEGVGASAYSGAAQFLITPEFVTAAGTILALEARHAGWLSASVGKGAPWGGSFETPLSMNEVFTLAAGFIVPGSCPPTNPNLNLTTFPALTLANAVPGQNAAVQYTSKVNATFVVFLFGLGQNFVPIDSEGNVAVPANLTGQVYGIATSSGTELTDSTTVAGPALLLFEKDSKGNLIN